MELLELSKDVIRQIMICYCDNSKVNQNKIKFIGSKILNEISDEINIHESAFYEACKRNRETNALQLINDEDCSYVSERGYTPLFLTCVLNMNDVALKLLDMDCKIDQVTRSDNKTNCTPLLSACFNGMYDVANKILDLSHRTTVDEIDGNGHTSLMYACRRKNMLAIAHRLLELDCKPEQVDIHGMTALILACRFNLHDIALKLLDMDCKIDQVDGNNKTALMYAQKNKLYDVIAKINNITKSVH
jgi:ankyrin repeat protein